MNNCYVDGNNLPFLESLYDNYVKDSSSVDQSWQQFFRNLENNSITLSPPESSNKKTYTSENEEGPYKLSTKILSLIDAYREKGHRVAQLDPLVLTKPTCPEELSLEFYNLKPSDLNTEVPKSFTYLGLNLSQLIEKLKSIYCGTIGAEFMHLVNIHEKAWFQQQFEENIEWRTQFSIEQKRNIFEQIAKAEMFEKFINMKFPGAKRFSIEGSEALSAIVETIIFKASNQITEEIVVGMAHRGRVNFLCNVFNKSYKAIFSEFAGKSAFPENIGISGDVKYHAGASTDRTTSEGRKIHLTLCANPSHLEAVDPIVLGKVRAKQDDYNDTERKKVKGILIHGDAAFAAQGVVYEAFVLKTVEGYNTGGVIHIIVNNQVGFTTNPKEARNFAHPSFLAKGFDLPILHVNADDVEAAVFIAQIAVAYSYTFKKDIIIDLVSYRRHGHNELDEPRFTQPLMYKKIDALPTLMTSYSQSLIEKGTLTSDDIKGIQEKIRSQFDEELKLSTSYIVDKADAYEGKWQNISLSAEKNESLITGVKKDNLMFLGAALTKIPSNYRFNEKIIKFIEHRTKSLSSLVDWSTAEALAFASLLNEGFKVRLTGQDFGRGTFTQRHAIWIDQNTGEIYTPFDHISPHQANIYIVNSPLTEYGALGFEYGYSLVNPNNLVVWEAQFGDFVNGAQVIIDQFIASAETKWLRSSGLVVLLPHGYEGQGPEHSSGRIERFLQLAAENNMRIVNCSTPANYFHSLRRQLMGKTRKPLIVFSPKYLLRHKNAVSSLEEMSEGTYFKTIIEDIKSLNSDEVEKVVLCSGKIYYELEELRNKLQVTNVALIRIEQFYPFPLEELSQEIKRYNKASLVWCQEEPQNMGGWSFIFQNLSAQGLQIEYIGRKLAASPATGYTSVHNQQQQDILTKAITITRAIDSIKPQ